MAYLRIKWIKGHPYLYEQSSYRVGAKVRTKHIRYIGKYGYRRVGVGVGVGGFIPPVGLGEDRRRYIDKEIARLQMGDKFPYARDILRQYLYHQNYKFSGAIRQRRAYGFVTVTRQSGIVTGMGLQANSAPFTWMHEMGHSLEFADNLIDDELQNQRWQFVVELHQAYHTAVVGDLVAKQTFIHQYAALIDIRRDTFNGDWNYKSIEERAIWQRLEMAKSGKIPIEAFESDFREWVNVGYRLTTAEIFADSVASLILNPKQAFDAHTAIGKQYLSKLYVRLYAHLENKYQISLTPSEASKEVV